MLHLLLDTSVHQAWVILSAELGDILLQELYAPCLLIECEWSHELVL